jgi:hypothetical protein
MAKRKIDTSQDWFCWSDGRPFTAPELRKMSHILKRIKQPGETFRARFERLRATIEEFEATKSRIKVRRPCWPVRTWNWVRGRDTVLVRMEP